MNNIDKHLIDKFTELIGELMNAPQANPTQARKYTRARGFVEKGLRQIAAGYRRELQRPASIGLPVHELKPAQEPERYDPPSDVLADNLPDVEEEKPKPVRKTQKKKDETKS